MKQAHVSLTKQKHEQKYETLELLFISHFAFTEISHKSCLCLFSSLFTSQCLVNPSVPACALTTPSQRLARVTDDLHVFSWHFSNILHRSAASSGKPGLLQLPSHLLPLPSYSVAAAFQFHPASPTIQCGHVSALLLTWGNTFIVHTVLSWGCIYLQIFLCCLGFNSIDPQTVHTSMSPFCTIPQFQIPKGTGWLESPRSCLEDSFTSLCLKAKLWCVPLNSTFSTWYPCPVSYANKT